MASDAEVAGFFIAVLFRDAPGGAQVIGRDFMTADVAGSSFANRQCDSA